MYIYIVRKTNGKGYQIVYLEKMGKSNIIGVIVNEEIIGREVEVAIMIVMKGN